MNDILRLAERNSRTAMEIIRRTRLVEIWREAGADPHMVGSLAMGLLMKHRDIDFHIYSSPVTADGSFAAMARLAECPEIRRIECRNLLHSPEACIEWHAWWAEEEGEEWQIDMIHILRGSHYDGYFERMAARISAALTDRTRETILRLKFETPDDCHIMGIEYYQAVLRDGIRTWDEFAAWRTAHPVTGIVEWMP